MSDIENIEYRFLIIGDEKVGKKSIINRFKSMNSTRTYEYEDISEPPLAERNDTGVNVSVDMPCLR